MVAVFLANMVTVSAWAKPCLNGGAMDTPAQSEMMMDHGNMPCEDMHQNQDQDDRQHCDGVCLCFHTCTFKSSMINESLSLDSPILSTLTYNIRDDRFIGILNSTLKPPPRA